MKEPRTPIPWTSRTILHLAVVEDVDFAFLAANQHAKLVKALKPFVERLYRKDHDREPDDSMAVSTTSGIPITWGEIRYARDVIEETERES